AAVFRKAIEVDPKNAADYLTQLSLTLSGQGIPDDAIDALRKLTELNPKDPGVHLRLGHALQRQGKLDEAVTVFRQALGLDYRNAEAHNSLGNALNDQGKTVEAAAAFRRAVDLSPDNAGFRSDLAWLLATCSDVRLRDPAQAVALARRAAELAPKDASV